MELSKVTNEDGIQCVQLIKALTAARFDNVSTKDLEAIVSAKKWLHALAGLLATQLRPSATAPSPVPESGMRIKAMGPLAPGKAVSSTGKKKRK